jgi:phosphotransferase system enzyme I (PtsP)
LAVLVRRTREVIGADVCTVYFTDEDNHRHVIAATDGLSSQVVGKFECGFGKGLAGRVAESRRALNFEQVPPELDQDFLRQTGDAPYRSFLGVPVVHKTRVQGVLLVRQHEVRRFDHTDEAFLATLAAQLGGALAYAKASGEWCRVCLPQAAMPARIEGLAGAPGLAIGHGVVVPGAGQIDQIPDCAVEDVSAEEIRLCAAVQAVREDITELGRELEGTLSEADRALFDAYALMLDSPEILDAARDRVRQGVSAPAAVSRAIDACTSRFDTMQAPYLRERAADIRALGGRILSNLLGNAGAVTIGQHATVLIGQSLSAIDIGQALKGDLVGIISGDGSPLSHAAILARALGIPAVVGIFGLPLARLDGQELVVDGTAGQVHLRLSAAMRQAFEQTIDNQRRQSQTLESVRGLDAVTADGNSVALYINAGLSLDLEPAATTGSAGIGLFRSELPFMLFDRLPSEHEQQQIYRQMLEAVHPFACHPAYTGRGWRQESALPGYGSQSCARLAGHTLSAGSS